MSVELLQLLSLVSYIMAGIMFLFAIALFFLLSIPKVVGDITGANAKKAIENIRQQNEISGNKAYKPSPVNASRGRVTDNISAVGDPGSKLNNFGVAVETAKLSTAKLSREAEETMLLDNLQNETTVLDGASETTVLSADIDSVETTVLQEETYIGFSVDFEIGFIGSSEIIE